MSYYYNGMGQRFCLPERALEPPDVWADEEEYEDEEDDEQWMS